MSGGGDENGNSHAFLESCSHSESESDVDLPSSDDELSAKIRCPRAKSSRLHCDCERSGCRAPSIGTVCFFLSKIVPVSGQDAHYPPPDPDAMPTYDDRPALPGCP